MSFVCLGKEIPQNSKTTSQTPEAAGRTREGQMWDLALKAVRLPQIGVFVEGGEWRSSAKVAGDTGGLSLWEVFSTLRDHLFSLTHFRCWSDPSCLPYFYHLSSHHSAAFLLPCHLWGSSHEGCHPCVLFR